MQPRTLAVHRSRDLVGDFRLLRPATVAEACGMLEAPDEAVPLAGGLEVINRMKEGHTPGCLVALVAIAALRGIRLTPERDALDVAAMTTHDELVRHPLVLEHLPDLAACWDRIANIRIRMQGTIVGNVLANNPGYDGPVLLAAVGARLVRASRRGAAPVEAAPWSDGSDPAITGSPGLVTAARVPLPAPGVKRRLLHERSLRYALSLALCLDIAGDRVVAATAVLGGCHARPLTRPVEAAGLSLAAFRRNAVDLATLAFSQLPPPSVPWFGTPGYRERMAPILLGRLIEAVAA